MKYVRCPYCSKSDGNDDTIIDKRIDYINTAECQIIIKKRCDICGKIYEVQAVYSFKYEIVSEAKPRNIYEAVLDELTN